MSETVITQVSPWFDEREKALINECLDAAWITEGPKSAEFQSRLNELIGTPYGVFAPNGTLALVLGLLALGIGPGDEVLVPDTTFIGSANAVIMTGATPIFVEVTAGNFQIDLAGADVLVTGKTKAIMPVHMFGMCGDMDVVRAFAARHGLLIIEDAAQAIGVSYDGVHAGAMGDVGCFSFFADKTITTGEGGYVVCKDEAVYDRLRLLRNQGRFDRGAYVHPAIGYNFRITDLQAAIGLAQLEKMPEILARKASHLARYTQNLAGLDEVYLLTPQPKSDYVPFRLFLFSPAGQALLDHVNAHGVQSRPFFYPLHRQPCFECLTETQALDDARFPNAIRAYEHGQCLPIHPALTDSQIDRVCEIVRGYFGK